MCKDDGIPKFILSADRPNAAAALKAFIINLNVYSDERCYLESLYDEFRKYIEDHPEGD